ncbi:hypothetical protein VTO73DRAFT_15110 [Trametes versicolor]
MRRCKQFNPERKTETTYRGCVRAHLAPPVLLTRGGWGRGTDARWIVYHMPSVTGANFEDEKGAYNGGLFRMLSRAGRGSA